MRLFSPVLVFVLLFVSAAYGANLTPPAVGDTESICLEQALQVNGDDWDNHVLPAFFSGRECRSECSDEFYACTRRCNRSSDPAECRNDCRDDHAGCIDSC